MSTLKYVYKEYDPVFPSLFETEKARLQSVVGNEVQIEHLGSTAVPGLGGKGIIDIYIPLPRSEMSGVSQRLAEIGYEFRPGTGGEERLFHQVIRPDVKEGSRRYHVHLVPLQSKLFHQAVAFRDYLRTHPAALEEYAQAKRQAAAVAHEDKETYMQGKAGVITKILIEIEKQQNNKRTPQQ